MDAGRSRPSAAGKHEWNSYESYCIAHENVLETHSFIKSHNVTIDLVDYQGSLYVVIQGEIRCRNNVVLTVEKYAETDWRGRRNPQLWARTFSYRYNAHKGGAHTLLRYDNSHDFEDYHVHRYDPEAGALLETRALSRDEMPHLSEVLDELQEMFG